MLGQALHLLRECTAADTVAVEVDTYHVCEAVRHVLDWQRAGRQLADRAAPGAPRGVATRRDQPRLGLWRLHAANIMAVQWTSPIIKPTRSTRTAC